MNENDGAAKNMRAYDDLVAQLQPLVKTLHEVRAQGAAGLGVLAHARAFLNERACEIGATEQQNEELHRSNLELSSALGAANEEIRRLRIENHRSAQRAFKLQPGLRVRVGDHLGEVVDQPVMVPVLFDGMHVTGRFDEKFVHWVPPTGSVTDGAGKVIGEATGLRVTPLEPREEDGTPIPYALVDRPVPVDGERRRFHHEPGNASDYLEALSDELDHGPRRPLRIETIASGHVLKIHISFDVPDRRGELTDLLFVAEKGPDGR